MSLPSFSNTGPFPMRKPEHDKRERTRSSSPHATLHLARTFFHFSNIDLPTLRDELHKTAHVSSRQAQISSQLRVAVNRRTTDLDNLRDTPSSILLGRPSHGHQRLRM